MSTLAWLWLFDHPTAPSTIRLLCSDRTIPCTGDARLGPFSVILVNIWFGAPFFMIMYLASLKSV